MCTLIVAHKLFDKFPVVVAANRDELLDRPSEMPCLRDSGIFAPKDLQRGGSWIGVNESGLFVALTNLTRIKSIKSKPHRMSRGQVVMDLLHQKTAQLAFKEAELLRGDNLNGFNLVIADREDMYFLRGNGITIERFTKSGQLLVATNLGVADYDREVIPDRCSVIKESLSRNLIMDSEPNLENLVKLLDIHDSCMMAGTCIHQPEVNYGTKSSSIIRLSEATNEWEYWHRERTSLDKHVCSEQFGNKMTLKITKS